MNELKKYIFEQIDNLLDYKDSRPNSIVIFGIQKNEILELYEQVSEYFKGIVNQDFDEDYDAEMKVELINFDIYEYHNKRKRKAFLDDTLDFARLSEYNRTKDKFLFKILSEDEREYIDLHEFVVKLNGLKYGFIHNFYESKINEWSLIDMMRRNFKWNRLKWSIICIEPNIDFWEKGKTDELKFEVYYNRKIFDLAQNITPIENRLKTELDNLGISYEFQYPVGKYILDFHIENSLVKLNVECDGKEFHSDFEAKNHDNERDLYMQKCGYKVLRLPGVLIWNSPKFCVEKIQKLLNE